MDIGVMDCTSDSGSIRIHAALESSDILIRVPPEIFHCIFQFLKNDKQTLLSCALVSQYYRELSMPWLFAYIDVRSPQHLAGFLEFISTHPGLGPYVKQLDFYGYDYPLKPLVSHPEHVIRSIISSAIAALPSLNRLLLYCICFDTETSPTSTLPIADMDSEAQTTRHLPQLYISGHASTPSWTPILMWLLSRYRVDMLFLCGVLISPIEDSNSALGVDRLRSILQIPNLGIEICAREQDDPYSLLGTLLQPGCLKEVYMLCIDHFCASRILRFMRTTGCNVTNISFNISCLSVEEAPDDPVALSWDVLGETLTCCPRLKTLHIRMSAFSMRDYSGLPRHTVFTTIVPCASRSLRNLMIELVPAGLWNHATDMLETWDLRALAEYLTRKPAQFPSLCNVHVELGLRKPNHNEELAAILLPKLSPLKGAGVLQVFCNEMTESTRVALGIELFPEHDY